MRKMKRELVIVGGGPAGLAAAITARKKGCRDILLIERDRKLGGILNQCIHDGFGLQRFKEALTGPEYAQRFIDEFHKLNINTMLETSVIGMNRDRILYVSSKGGLIEIKARAIILSMGCREKAAGAITLPGSRPAGIYTAGAAQNFINQQNLMVGKRAVVLGSGDIGLIMARRMTLEGIKVSGVFEILPYASGLPRNILQCLKDYKIPLYLSTSVIDIQGKHRLQGVTVSQVDKGRRFIQGTQRFVPCDTLILSVGLIPENELSRSAGIKMDSRSGGALVDETFMTSIEGVFSCGNVLHVHDVVDYVSDEAERAGDCAVGYLNAELKSPESYVVITPKQGVRYVLPQKVSKLRDFIISLRVTEPFQNKSVLITDGKEKIGRKKFLRLNPAEMIQIKVRADKLKTVNKLEVKVE